jgi:hypothetical protein
VTWEFSLTTVLVPVCSPRFGIKGTFIRCCSPDERAEGRGGAVYLRRITGADNIDIGLPVNWRLDQRRRAAPAMAMSILPIRLAVRGTAPRLSWRGTADCWMRT